MAYCKQLSHGITLQHIYSQPMPVCAMCAIPLWDIHGMCDRLPDIPHTRQLHACIVCCLFKPGLHSFVEAISAGLCNQIILSPLREAKSQKHVILVGLKHNEETDMFSSHAAACCPSQVPTSC